MRGRRRYHRCVFINVKSNVEETNENDFHLPRSPLLRAMGRAGAGSVVWNYLLSWSTECNCI